MESSRKILFVACIVALATLVCCDGGSSPPPTQPQGVGPDSAPGGAPGGGTTQAGNPAPAPGGPPPPITAGAGAKDVLGDAEKNKVCGVQSAGLCQAAGAADPICNQLAQAVGKTQDVSCEAAGICKFTVSNPQQHPQQPGDAWLTVGAKEGYGVIFPCQTGGLVISVPLNLIGGNGGGNGTTQAPPPKST